LVVLRVSRGPSEQAERLGRQNSAGLTVIFSLERAALKRCGVKLLPELGAVRWWHRE
jgi:hypothetical protein